MTPPIAKKKDVISTIELHQVIFKKGEGLSSSFKMSKEGE